MRALIENVKDWAEARHLLKAENVPTQTMKVMEELGELCSAILKRRDDEIVDGLGDVMVTLIILAAQMDLDLEWCLATAYEEIKDRRGKTVGGSFVKFEGEQ